MSIFGTIHRFFARRVSARGPRIVVFGDSHTASLMRAKDFSERCEDYKNIEVYRLRKAKGSVIIGDIETEKFLKIVSQLTEDDFLISAIGGNQYAIFSTVLSNPPFTFAEDFDDPLHDQNSHLIPARVVRHYLSSGVNGTDRELIEKLRDKTRSQFVHLVPPPPKQDNKFIRDSHESRFSDEGIQTFGVSAPELRLKSWILQQSLIHEMCENLQIDYLDPPTAARNAEGFLGERYYARDATHANRRYGELVLKQILNYVATHSEFE